MNLTAFNTVLAAPKAQPTKTFDALYKLTNDLIGVKLFTLITFCESSNAATRLYSNMPDAYPVAGTKEVEENLWTTRVLRQHNTFVANSIEEIAEVFPDFDLIQSLGCESCINIPVIVCGSVIGTLNCLHENGYFTPERVAKSEHLKLPGAAAFLAAKQIETGV